MSNNKIFTCVYCEHDFTSPSSFSNHRKQCREKKELVYSNEQFKIVISKMKSEHNEQIKRLEQQLLNTTKINELLIKKL